MLDLAAGSGASLADLAALTARTEVLADAPNDALECSTLVRLTATGPSGVQTWDWHAELVPGAASTQSTTDARLAHLRSVAPGVAAACGAAGANAPVCMRPADSPHLADRWETLITIAMVPGTGELHWQTGLPAG